ncbi:MAG: lipid-A-disaccharide synthase [Candidatus Omnitrophota bacterium]
MSKKIIIVAGEASGDLHASLLVKSLKSASNVNMEFFGLGGTKMQEAGVHIYYNTIDLAVVGIFEVLKNLAKFKEIFRQLLYKIDEIKPDLVILVDYPGFNLRLAKEVKKRNIPLIYYISPQVWAWGRSRIKQIKKYVDKMIVILRFEETFYQSYGVDAVFVGHPLLDIVKTNFNKDELLNSLLLDKKNTTISMLPGSRETEVRTLLPIMLETARLISKKLPESQFLILKSASLKEGLFQAIMARYPQINTKLINNLTYEGINASNLAIVASGTATLETAILEKPMVIVYKVNFLTGLYLRWAIKIPYVGLVNVIMGRKFIPEFIQYQARPGKIAREVLSILGDSERIAALKRELRFLKSQLGSSGATERAAKEILKFLAKN